MLDECYNDELVQAEWNTQQKHRVNCSFYLKIGACRHGDKCSRLHTRPTSSKTILLKNFYHFGGIIRQDFPKEKEQREFDEFFREVYLEIDEEYGEIDEMNVCDNTGEHMLGNVYIKFMHESNASNAVKALNNRWFNGKPIHCELSPVSDFRDACCRQYENGECSRGGFCNFMHLKKVSSSLKRKLEKESEGRKRRKKSAKLRKISECSCKKIDGSLPKKYQDAFSSDESSSWSDYGPSSSGNHRSLTPFAFRADRYTSDVSESDSETDPEFEAHKQLLRRQRWEELRDKFEMQQKWDEDRERNFVFSLL
ncbi:Zinc finger C-x8-C-x5-C-x3-H type (and similar) family protein [Brugia pahangi]